jgi:hypothetical protein
MPYNPREFRIKPAAAAGQIAKDKTSQIVLKATRWFKGGGEVVKGEKIKKPHQVELLVHSSLMCSRPTLQAAASHNAPCD